MYETGKDYTSKADRLKKGKGSASANNIMGRLSNSKYEGKIKAAMHKSMTGRETIDRDVENFKTKKRSKMKALASKMK